ncbi:DNA excision repair protein ERCC-4 [Enteropsectra breve]|nr:DNA excision repair protein ERCC-4 [Enteropsectra breve]
MLCEATMDNIILGTINYSSPLYILPTGQPMASLLINTIKLYASSKCICIILNLSHADAKYISDEIISYFTCINTLTTKQREETYKRGGVFYGSSVAFLTDFLNTNIPLGKISCIHIMKPEEIFSDYQSMFLLQIFKRNNMLGLVRAYTNNPSSFYFKGLIGHSLKDKINIFTTISHDGSGGTGFTPGHKYFTEIQKRIFTNRIVLLNGRDCQDLNFKELKIKPNEHIAKIFKNIGCIISGILHKYKIDSTLHMHILACCHPEWAQGLGKMRILTYLLYFSDPLTLLISCKRFVEAEKKSFSGEAWAFSVECIDLLISCQEYLAVSIKPVLEKHEVSEKELIAYMLRQAEEMDEEKSKKPEKMSKTILDYFGNSCKKIKNDNNSNEDSQEKEIANMEIECAIQDFYENFSLYTLVKKVVKENAGKTLVVVPTIFCKHPLKTILVNNEPNSGVNILCVSEMHRDTRSYDNIVVFGDNLTTRRNIMGRNGVKHLLKLTVDDKFVDKLLEAEIKEESYAFKMMGYSGKSRIILGLVELISDLNKVDQCNEGSIDIRESDIKIHSIALERHEEVNDGLVGEEIIVDSRELKAQLPFYLYKACFKLDLQTLETGDYIFNGYCVERKRIDDLKASLADGRLYQQASRMENGSLKPCLLIEFESEKIGLLAHEVPNNMQNSLIMKMAVFLSTFRRFLVFWSYDAEFSVELLKGLSNGLEQQSYHTPKTEDEIILENILLSVPCVNSRNIKLIKKEFKYLKEFIQASKDRLMKVFNMRDAETVFKYFNSSIQLS